MEKLNFSIEINAPREKVWNVLWDDPTYRQWTAAFSEGSHAIGSWEEGSKIQFLDGKGSGMFSLIHKKIPNTEMTFRHLGEIKDGIEKESAWTGAMESYFLSGNVKTELRVEIDTGTDFQQYFTETFPKALSIVKSLSEK